MEIDTTDKNMPRSRVAFDKCVYVCCMCDKKAKIAY